MDRYIGLDAHASSCTLGVVTPSGKQVGSHVVETNARCLIEAVQQIPEPRHICPAEGRWYSRKRVSGEPGAVQDPRSGSPSPPAPNGTSGE